jgi:hypothetical protein
MLVTDRFPIDPIRMPMDRSKRYSVTSDAFTQGTSVDSSLGVRVPPVARAVRRIENSCRASPLLVYRTAQFSLSDRR